MKRKVSKEEWIASIINNIKERKPKVRQLSKSPYFALNYAGTFRTLQKNLGFSEEKAKFIEDSHKEKYKVYYDYVSKQIEEAKTKGYVTLAFGLKLRTPRIADPDASPHKVEAEMRSAGNALFQSYSFLTLRALTRFMKRVWAHEQYKTQIFPVVTIYDSIYLDIPNDIECLHWVNENLIECMKMMDGCEELIHPNIALGADLELLYQSFNTSVTIPNNSSIESMLKIIEEEVE